MAAINITVNLTESNTTAALQNILRLTQQINGQNIKINVDATGLDNLSAANTKALNAISRVINAQAEQEKQQRKTVQSTKQVTEATNKAGDSIASLTQKVSKWALSTALVYAPIRAFKEAVKELKAVDDELVQVRKVTGLAGEELERLKDRAYATASAYGEVASEYLNSVAIFSRAGYGDRAEGLAELSTKLELIGNMDAEVASNTILALDAAYKYRGELTKLSAVIDGMNRLDNEYSSQLSSIAVGLGIVASVAENAGVGVDELSAALGTLEAKTRRPASESARALRAILLNIRQDTVTALSDDGSETWSTEEVEKFAKTLEKAGVATTEIVDGVSTLRNPMKILDDYADRYHAAMEKGGAAAVDAQNQLSSLADALGGKLRSNQFLALIGGWKDTYEPMVADFNNAIGSADKEIENAMDSWTRKANILKNTWTEFISKSVSTDAIKGFLDVGTEIIKFEDSLGLTITQVAALTLALNGIGATEKVINGVSKALGTTKTSVLAAYEAMNGSLKTSTVYTQTYTATKAALIKATNLEEHAIDANTIAQIENTAAKKASAAAIGSMVSAIGLAVAAVTLGVQVYRRIQQAQDEARAAAVKLADENLKQVQVYKDLQQQYLDIIDSTATEAEKDNQLAEFKKLLIEQYGFEEDAIKGVNKERKTGIDLLNQEMAAAATNAWAAIQDEYKEAVKYMEGAQTYRGNLLGEALQDFQADQLTAIAAALKEYGVVMRDMGDGQYNFTLGEFDGAQAKVDNLSKALITLDKHIEKNGDDTGTLAYLYEQLQAEYDDTTEKVKDLEEAYKSGAEAQAAFIVYANAEKVAAVDSKKAFEDLTNELISLSDGSTATEKAIIAAMGAVTGYKYSVEQTTAAVTDATQKVSALGKVINGVKGNYKLLTDAEKEFKENGYLAIESVEALINAGLGEFLSKTEKGYGLVNGSLEAYIKSQRAEYEIAVNEAVTAAKQLVKNQTGVALAYDATTESVLASVRAQREAARMAGITAAKVGDNYVSRTESANIVAGLADYNSAIQNILDAQGELEDFDRVIETLGKTSAASGKKAKTAADEAKEAWSKVADIANYMLKQRKRVADEATDAIDAEIDRLEKYQDEQEKAAEAEIDRLEAELDRLQNALEDTEEHLKALRDQSVDAKQAEIDALKDARDIEQDQLALEEKRLAVEKARQDLLAAQTERTVRYYNAAEGKWEWQADAGNVAKAKEAMADAETELEEYIKELAYKDRIKELEAERDRIKAFYDAELDAIEAREKSLEKQYEADIDAAKKRKEAIETQYEGWISATEKRRDAIQAEYDALAAQWDAIQNSINRPAEDIAALLQQLSKNDLPQFAGIIDTVGAFLAGLGGVSYTPSTITGGSGAWGGGSSYPGTLIKQGQTNDYVKQIQAALGVRQTGYFGTETLAAVRGFQGSNGLSVDGIVGPDTWRKLFPVFDQGGIARGKGIIIKDTAEDELVLSPELTRALLKPQSDAQYSRNLASSGIMAGGAQVFNQASNAITTNNSSISDSHDTNFHVHGLTVNEPNPQWLTLEKLANSLDLYRLYSNNY